MHITIDNTIRTLTIHRAELQCTESHYEITVSTKQSGGHVVVHVRLVSESESEIETLD